jgi:hypothetical protein
MVPSKAGHHENSKIFQRFKGKKWRHVAPGFQLANESKAIAKGLTAKTDELLSKTSIGASAKQGGAPA